MIIHRIRLTNFRQHEATELELGPGLTGIIGPNGAGKTTILEAIAWAMYGVKAARGGKDSIRRRGAPPRAKVEVELEFTLGRHLYRVVRSLHTAELYQDGDPAAIANSLDTVSERLARILGMTREEFFNTYFTGQKQLALMAQMSGPERAQFLSRVLGYERIRAAQEQLKEKRAMLRARVQGLQASLPDAALLDRQETQARERLAVAEAAVAAGAAAFAAAEARLAEARPRWETMQRLRETAQRLEQDLRVARVELANARERFAALDRQADEAARAATEIAALRAELEPLAALRAEMRELDAQAAEAAKRQAQASQLEAARLQLAALDERAAKLPPAAALDEARAQVSALRAELTAMTIQATERRNAWVRDATDAQAKLQGLRDQYQELKEQHDAIHAAGRDGACPTCARALDGEFENVLGVIARQRDAVLQNGKYYNQRVEQLKDEPADLLELERRQLALQQEETRAVGQCSRVEAQVQEGVRLVEERGRLARRIGELAEAVGAAAAAYDQARHTEVRRRLGELEPAQLRAAQLQAAAERAPALAAERDALRTSGAAAAERVRVLELEFAGLGYAETAFAEARDAEQRAERERRETELGLVRARSEAAAAQEAVTAVARRREERAALEREAKQAGVELLTHQELDRAFTDLRTDLNATLRPELGEIASSFVRDLTNGRYSDLELDESYVPTLLDEGDPKQVISGGEEDVANLALRLAISQMIAERAGQPLSLLILDEIFGSLDEERRANVVELLRSLADRFPQVILITHIDAVREGFDRVVRVGLDTARGVSVVRDEPPGAMGADDVAA